MEQGEPWKVRMLKIIGIESQRVLFNEYEFVEEIGGGWDIDAK